MWSTVNIIIMVVYTTFIDPHVEKAVRRHFKKGWAIYLMHMVCAAICFGALFGLATLVGLPVGPNHN